MQQIQHMLVQLVCFKIVTKNRSCGEIRVEEVYPHNYHCCRNQSKEKVKDSMESKNGGTGYKKVSFPAQEVLGGTLDKLIATVHKDVWENTKKQQLYTYFIDASSLNCHFIKISQQV